MIAAELDEGAGGRVTATPRVALFSDSHYEANGVARTTTSLERYAAARNLPLLSIHAGDSTRLVHEGSIRRLELARWSPTSFGLEHDLRFDLAMWRHVRLVARTVTAFQPDVVHFTGPSEIGQLGAYLGHRLSIPMVASWHTNLHEYAARRLRLAWLDDQTRARVRDSVERWAFWACGLFYRIPRVILAPNEDVRSTLVAHTGRPAMLMSRGVDTSAFTPTKRTRTDTDINIGYVGRLSPEKGVRVLADIHDTLRNRTTPAVRFTIVGDGSEGAWLRGRLNGATFTGILRGEDLATAYANLDIFVFPSETDTVGNVMLEAMASGVPVVAVGRGGPLHVAGSSRAARLVPDHSSLVDAVLDLVDNEDERRAMSTAARELALERTWDRIFDEVYRAYDLAMRLAQPARAHANDPVIPIGS